MMLVLTLPPTFFQRERDSEFEMIAEVLGMISGSSSERMTMTCVTDKMGFVR
ncbi:hypothetical protein [Tabrizicola sp. TH137]|uniref:hypothetical protein n=1 Tax=Tabrizicola sp. TH137 TaxID=2067452 RepID=UPI001304005D|nr:hypothetical protein [Tabrizicola sp. TH137]